MGSILCEYTCAYIYIDTYIYIYMIYVHICMVIYIYICSSNIQVAVRGQNSSALRFNKASCMGSIVCIYIFTYIHINKYIHICIYTCIFSYNIHVAAGGQHSLALIYNKVSCRGSVVYRYIFTYICIYTFKYTYMYACVYIFKYISIQHTGGCGEALLARMYDEASCMSSIVCILHIYIYIYMYTYAYIYVHIYILILIHNIGCSRCTALVGAHRAL